MNLRVRKLNKWKDVDILNNTGKPTLLKGDVSAVAFLSKPNNQIVQK